MGLYTLIVSWWRARQRRLDVELLWPLCVAGAPDLERAKAAFRLHAMTDPAWRELGDDMIAACVELLGGARMNVQTKPEAVPQAQAVDLAAADRLARDLQPIRGGEGSGAVAAARSLSVSQSARPSLDSMRRPFEDHLRKTIEAQRRTIKDQTERIQELTGALHWLRNHYDGFTEHERREVLAVIDGVLHAEPRMIAADIKTFQRRYLRPS